MRSANFGVLLASVLALLSCGDASRRLDEHITCDAAGCACAAGFGDCDGDPANGCEVTLENPDHCGVCGHSCLGGSCVAGSCQPTLVSTWGLTEDLAATDNTLYFGGNDGGNGENEWILRAEASAWPEPWAVGVVDLPYVIGAGPEEVYVASWAYFPDIGDWACTALHAYPLNDPAHPRYLGEAEGWQAFAGGGYVYWHLPSYASVRSRMGSTERETVSFPSPEPGWLVGASDVGAYFLVDGDPFVVLHDGGPPVARLIEGFSGDVHDMKPAKNGEIFVRTDAGILRGRPGSGTSYSLVASSEDLGEVWRMALDDTHVYITQPPDILARVPRKGGPKEIVATGVLPDEDFAILEEVIYYRDHVVGSLVRLAKPAPAGLD